MLRIEIPGQEFFNEKTERFISTPPVVLELEHSLISISKWESKWKKAFLKKDAKRTYEESADYVRCMTLNKGVPDTVYNFIPMDIMSKIDKYINDRCTATWFREIPGGNGPRSNETITSELIYYWMIAHGIPFECQKWHINRLLTLIRICNAKAGKPKKMPKREAALERMEMNARRRASMNSRG